MGKFTAYDISLKGLIDDTQVIEYAIDGDFFKDIESQDIQGGEVKVHLTVKNSNGIYDFSFKINGVVTISCDRCLGDLEHVVDTEYHLCVKHGEEFSDESDELLIIPDNQMELNVVSLIYDSVVLTIPLKHNHIDGECDEDMRAYLSEHIAGEIDALEDEDGDELDGGELDSEEVSKPIDPRWEALMKLKK
ncbi:MAG: DUF177 domain-containing protein [Bacteroidales bacterium]